MWISFSFIFLSASPDKSAAISKPLVTWLSLVTDTAFALHHSLLHATCSVSLFPLSERRRPCLFSPLCSNILFEINVMSTSYLVIVQMPSDSKRSAWDPHTGAETFQHLVNDDGDIC